MSQRCWCGAPWETNHDKKAHPPATPRYPVAAVTHLPECDYERQDYRGKDNRICYCSRLRARDQRVLGEVEATLLEIERMEAHGYPTISPLMAVRAMREERK